MPHLDAVMMECERLKIKVICEVILNKIRQWYTLLVYHMEFFLMQLVVVRKIPRHVAFIMDGNRRYAREMNLPIPMGHLEGLQMLQRLLRWLYLLRVPEVTVYAFSIENFKRPQSEVSLLQAIARNAIYHVKRHEIDYRRANIRFQLIGRIDMLPEDIRQVLISAEAQTKDCTGMRINIAAAYTSRDDIVGGIRKVCRKVVNSAMHPHDVNEEEIERNLRTNRCNKPDLLIRTSGETRLSDFLLWEVCDSMLYFLPKNWPCLTLWDIVKALLHFQRHSKGLPGDKSGVKVDSVVKDEQHTRPYVEEVEDYLEAHQEIKNTMYILDNFQRYTKVRGMSGRA
ncbi:dehydrodolichyl diphosphate synthase complex subunit DHDDS-like [Lutzomyia longipalpis]|uniref:dehydrodolichyl diphosphate synthase complex subunit DHDDS-like n=1 Tax=Lutzomyia longipalpis TaxID=7200 RepID=UPI00248414BD|nr:dehydrodolichyl diphosphate synthase complex subunit DHDDS-like [Lutzomyia longipalpis]